ncbi:MAG: hypothetical protein KF778_06525 [Rhodocyclaceae bacterium]|nr:hypothetical protein [Rhodocyclaceae bacterium]MBX3668041.1 hypothetical protein [Rhodocyclaceae bacterium]
MNGTIVAPLAQTFMTHRMSDEAITALATGREHETARVMDAIERSLKAVPGALQHVLIYGPRGFGKSFMARLAQIETGKLAAERGLPIPFVLLPEEQHNLTRNPHALPAYIAHRLADLRTGEDRSWTGAMFQWPDPHKEVSQWKEATAELEKELDLSLPGGAGMAIVVVENFDLLLFNLFKEAPAEQRLRKWLDRRDNRIMLIATATGTVDMDYERPLFQAFQSIRLEPWGPDGCIAYFNRRRQAEGKPPLDAAMEAKARAVADFIGGNPRLAQLLADVLDTQDALSVADTMKALADKLSDYYRRRIDDLPPLAQGLLDAVIRGGEPASQTELAKRVGAPAQSTIARVMQDLQQSDILCGLPAPDGREILYRVTDRVFAYFYRLRQGNQMALATPLATILEFLRTFYTRDEQKLQAARHLDAGRHAEGRLFADLAREGGAGDTLLANYCESFACRMQTFIDSTPEPPPVPAAELLLEIEHRPQALIGKVQAWQCATPVMQAFAVAIKAQCYAHLGLAEKADECMERQLAVSENPAACFLLHLERAAMCWARGDAAGEMREFAAAGELDVPELPPRLRAGVLVLLADSLFKSGSFVDALSVARKAAKLAAHGGYTELQVPVLGLVASALEKTGHGDEDIVTASEAAHLAEKAGDLAGRADALLRVAQSLNGLKRYAEAVATAREAADLAENAGNLAQQADGLTLAARALGELDRHDDAASTARESAKLAERAGDAVEQELALSIAARSLARLGRHDEAAVLATDAADLAAQTGDPGRQAAYLSIAASSLNELAKHAEALASALAGFELARSAGDCWLMRANMFGALDAAVYHPSSAALTAFLDWVDWEINHATDDSRLGWMFWLGRAFTVAARACAWDIWDTIVASLSEQRLDYPAELSFGANLGKAVALCGQHGGRAEGFETARAALPRLARLLELTGADGGKRRIEFISFATALAMQCRNPGMLRDIAGLLTLELTEAGPHLAYLLSAAAEIDEAADSQVVLARMPPDWALILRRIRNLLEPDKRTRRGRPRSNKKP